MVRTTALGLALVMALSAGVERIHADQRPQPKPIRLQAQYDDKRGVAYALSHLADGGVQLSAQSPELEFQKTSYQDGHFELRMASHGDRVVFAVSQAGIQLTRGNKTMTLPAGATEADFDKARAFVAGSRAVKRYRQLSASLEDADDNSPASQSTLIGAAIVGLIDGDGGAPARIARRLGGKTRASLRKVGRSVDCWAWFQNRVYDAWVDYEDCVSMASWWNRDLVTNACTFRWVIRAEGYWFQYAGCSAFPF